MLERFKLLEENIRGLSEFKKISLKDIQSDRSKEWALRYGFLETIQIVIDIACHIVSKYNLGNPSTYSECIELLEKYNYLNDELASRVLGMVGLRNILVHEYLVIDTAKLHQLLDNLEDINKFVDCLKQFI